MVLGKRRVPDSVAGIGELHGLVAEHADDDEAVIVGIEIDRGLVVWSLLAAGYEVYAINPMASARYRDRHATSGAKSDPGDAKVLADLVRTDRHNHRPIAGDSDLAEGVKVLGPGPPERHLGPPAPAQCAALVAARVLPRGPGGLRHRSGQHRRPGRPGHRPDTRARPGAVALEDRLGAAQGWPPAQHRAAGRRDPGGPARRVPRGTRADHQGPRARHPLGAGAHRHVQRPDRRARGGAVGAF